MPNPQQDCPHHLGFGRQLSHGPSMMYHMWNALFCFVPLFYIALSASSSHAQGSGQAHLAAANQPNAPHVVFAAAAAVSILGNGRQVDKRRFCSVVHVNYASAGNVMRPTPLPSHRSPQRGTSSYGRMTSVKCTQISRWA